MWRIRHKIYPSLLSSRASCKQVNLSLLLPCMHPKELACTISHYTNNFQPKTFNSSQQVDVLDVYWYLDNHVQVAVFCHALTVPRSTISPVYMYSNSLLPSSHQLLKYNIFFLLRADQPSILDFHFVLKPSLAIRVYNLRNVRSEGNLMNPTDLVAL